MGFWTYRRRNQYHVPCWAGRGTGVRGPKLTPTVVKTSWSLLTSVMSVGSLTLMLPASMLAVALPVGEGLFGRVPNTHAVGLVAMAGELSGGECLYRGAGRSGFGLDGRVCSEVCRGARAWNIQVDETRGPRLVLVPAT